MRATAALTVKLERDLVAYVTVASAAGLGMLAVGGAAEAEVIYTPAHVIIDSGSSYYLDLNGDNTAEFLFKNYLYCELWCSEYLRVIAEQSRNAVASNGHGSALAMRWGQAIGSNRQFESVPATMVRLLISSSGGTIFKKGLWFNVNGRYLGLRFRLNGRRHYGWARLSVSVQREHIVATLTGYAYETIPGKLILAGDKGLPTYKPAGGLGHLALGAAARKPARR